MNYDEFIKENKDKLEELNYLRFSEKESLLFTTISDDPSKYVDIAAQCENLQYILLENVRDFEYYKSISEFLKNSNDNVRVANGPVGKATKQEFFRAEEIIQEILSKINPEWTKKQKAAFVHYQMGKIVSYAPDFCFSGKYVGSKAANDSRNIWKSIDSGVSVCNGVTAIQRNILSRIGIKTQELSSGTHSFMLVETEEGNIITDATWDLSNTLFEARPMYFGKTYEELQQIDGVFSKAHKLEQIPDNVIGISDTELRDIYYNIGIANEDRKFKLPILEKLDEIGAQSFKNSKEKLNALLKMFTEEFSRQATHLSESREMLELCMKTLGFDSKDITTKFVYSIEDAECEKPQLCIHLNGGEIKSSIAVLNTEKMRFEDLSIKDFDAIYKTHEEDTREPFWKKYLHRQDDILIETEKDRTSL